ncbi:ubiquinol-cytochrome c reductase iron-sulfur subunit [Thiorhodovibrio frisius]|uniref:Ubiquinol-cytochrome c reductase iron-sulfur subunit n=1 Tax=Thiorhodovibrio frisius TaxID=631362 RepID=H8Z5U0_9GAMM|nr:ubiquinol-cytochrome c reductase iron-sulfur subunit [Thiorhodovibrio frisius]EIC19574.1 ubiquinol-cytochrome c reductase, iron-sulfur subunit [Thiorhodovibrio frisius]WPL20464.1 Ubiquinol-cytochrome c reductase iron-sulfur subunit [Thiorhodovibrio frisius]
MSAQGVNKTRRRVLVAATSVVGAVGAGFVAVPFIASMNPSAKARAAGAPVKADITKLEPGALLRVKFRGQPIWVVSRTPEMLENLPKNDSKLVDPQSTVPQQPEYCQNPTRSIKPQYFVAIGICTHLGCSPTYRPEMAPDDLGAEWKGGWFCPCHGSKFDLAGRVFKGVPAPTNLVIPKHTYLTDTTILVGEDGGQA